MKLALALAGLILAGGVLAAPAGAATIVYQNNFEGGGANTNGFSGVGGIQTSANSTQKFYGFLSSMDSMDLTINGLTGYNTVTIKFDLYTINSLDGSGIGNCCGPDTLKISHGADVLLNTESFTNNDVWYQSYGGGATPGPNGSDTALTGQLGYNFYGPDHTYHMSYTVGISAVSSTVFNFLAHAEEGWDNEGFGFDNFVVTADLVTTPIPAALPLFMSGLGVMGWAAYRRRKQAAAA